MEFLLVWLLFAIATAAVGGRTNRAGTGFLLGLLLGPFGLIIMLVSKGPRKECPFCREWVHPKAIVCPHCQRDLPAPNNQGPAAKPATPYHYKSQTNIDQVIADERERETSKS